MTTEEKVIEQARRARAERMDGALRRTLLEPRTTEELLREFSMLRGLTRTRAFVAEKMG